MPIPWLSVIMPTFNGDAYLEAALESLITQDDMEFEVIAIDDGSTDATLAILHEYQKRLPMTVVEREHEGNWVRNTNLGMAMGKGRYLCWLHQDDIWCPNRLTELRQLAHRWPESPMLFHPAWFIDAFGNRVGQWRCPFPRRQAVLSSEEVLEHLLVQNFIAAPSPIFRADTLALVGKLNERLWYCADWDYWLRLAALGAVAYHPEPLASFRVHSASQTTTCPRNTADIAEQFRLVLSRHLEVWERNARSSNRVGRIAQFSVELNLAMMRMMNGERAGWMQLMWHFAELGPPGWRAFLRDSRLVERVASRLLSEPGTTHFRGGCLGFLARLRLLRKRDRKRNTAPNLISTKL